MSILSGTGRVRNEHRDVILTKQTQLSDNKVQKFGRIKKNIILGIVQSFSGKVLVKSQIRISKFIVVHVDLDCKIFRSTTFFNYVHEAINSVISANGPPRKTIEKLYPSSYSSSRIHSCFDQLFFQFFNLNGGYTS